jgi:hypothetical protein
MSPVKTLQSRSRQVEAGLTVRESTDDAGSAPDLFHDPLQRIVGSDLLPVNVREAVVGQGLVDGLLDEVGSPTCLSAGRRRTFAVLSAASRLSWACWHARRRRRDTGVGAIRRPEGKVENAGAQLMTAGHNSLN